MNGVLPPSNSWQPAEPCSTNGVDGSPAITYGITITGSPAVIGAISNNQYVWTLTLNDGNTPANLTVDRWDSNGNLIDHPMEISGTNGSIQFNGPVYLSEDPIQPMEAATKQYADAGNLIGNEPPSGTGIYGRQNVGIGSWTSLAAPTLDYLPLAGGFVSGGITVRSDSGGVRYIAGQTATSLGYRWAAYFGDATAESGGNTGSNFVLQSFSDGGANTTQLSITRNGMMTIPGSLTVNGKINLNGPNNLTIGGGASGDTLITDGSGNLIWGSGGGGAGIPDAPLTGGPYGRQAAAWVVIPPPPIPNDAPSNANTYGRSGGNWVVVPPPVITGDAPAISQLYGRYNNGWVRVDSQFLPLSGGAMTGGIAFNGSGNSRAVAGQTAGALRWITYWGDNTPETGGNSGSNYVIQRYNDAGTLIDTPVTISRASGQMSITNPVTVPNPAPGDSSQSVATTSWVNSAISVVPQPPPISNANPLMNGVAAPGTAIAYSRGDHVHPSDTTRLPTTGGTITGTLGVNGFITQGTGSGAAQIYLNGGAGNARAISGMTNGSPRWAVVLGTATAESGSNIGSDYSVQRYTDAGVWIDAPFAIARSTGAATFSGGMTLSAGGLTISSGNIALNGGAAQISVPYWLTGGHRYNFGWTPATQGQLQIGIDAGAATYNIVKSNSAGVPYTGIIDTMAGGSNGTAAAWQGGTSWVWTTTSSDPRLKTNVIPATKDALAAIMAIGIYEFDMTPPVAEAEVQHWNWGVMADEALESAIPSSHIPATESSVGTTYAAVRELSIIAALVKAVQQLTARVEVLEAQLKGAN